MTILSKLCILICERSFKSCFKPNDDEEEEEEEEEEDEDEEEDDDDDTRKGGGRLDYDQKGIYFTDKPPRGSRNRY